MSLYIGAYSAMIENTQVIPDFRAFRPPPWAFNSHVHTIWPSLTDNTTKPEAEWMITDTPDGDFLEAETIILDNKKPVVALFHGQEGSSNRYYINRLMQQLYRYEISSAALNFRGCGPTMNRQPVFYHSGATSDYRVFTDELNRRYPDRDIMAVGFSLGGNALVKFLAECGNCSSISRAVVVSPPFDLRAGSLNMQQGFNRIYELNFLQTLKDKLERKKTQFPELPDFTGDTLYDFDDQVTAPVHGFRDADHYYKECSSRQFYPEIKIPLLIIHSREDTLCPLEYAPFSTIKENRYIDTLFTEKGGHVGFIDAAGDWLSETVCSYLTAEMD